VNGQNANTLDDVIEETTQAANTAREKLASDLHMLSEHAQEFMRVTSAVSGESVAAAREQLMQTVTTATDTLKRWQTEAMTQGRRAAQRADSYVHENPWQSIAAGMFVGVALGMAGSSMRNGKHRVSA
jgi:ElaB/YqjD/DUF883 family membrane-anchored ribosome-binding protein